MLRKLFLFGLAGVMLAMLSCASSRVQNLTKATQEALEMVKQEAQRAIKLTEQKVQNAVNNALGTSTTFLGPTAGPGMNADGFRNGAYNFNFFAPNVSNPVASTVNGSGRFPGSGLHIPLPGGADPTIQPWGPGTYMGQPGSFFTAHIDSANPMDDLVGLFRHFISDVLLRRPHGC